MASTKKAAQPAKTKSASSGDKPAFKTTAKAQEAARAGKIDDAIASLRIFADKGDILASCSLASLLAFRGEWDEVITRVQPLFAKPDTTYANVLLDMVGLLWRAAEETGRWKDADAALKKLPKKYAKEFVLIGRLGPYFAGGGKGEKPALDHGPDGTPAKRKAKFEKELKDAKAQKDAFLVFAASNDDPLFDDHAVATFAAAKKELDLRNTFFAAKAFVRKSRLDDAWKALEPKLGEWMEDEEAQIAPAHLLYDPDLYPMMTPERCRKVLERNA
jgi:hypothetical protein